MKIIPPAAIFILGALLGAYRDVLGESLMKGSVAYSPIYLLLLGCLTTLVLSFLLGMLFKPKFFQIPKAPGVYKDIIFANLFTFLSFWTYFEAIDSPLEAGINSVIAFGADPIFTAIVCRFLTNQKFGGKFYFCVAVSVFGIFLLGLRPLSESISDLWSIGLILCLISSLLYALYVIYLKRLSDRGLSPTQLAFYRFLLVGLFGIPYCLFQFEVLKPLTVSLLTYSVLGYALSVLIFTYCVSKLTLERIVILGFFFPIFTFVLSLLTRRAHYFWWEYAGVLLILSTVLVFEWENFRFRSWSLR